MTTLLDMTKKKPPVQGSADCRVSVAMKKSPVVAR
jgi:hypothetical protein